MDKSRAFCLACLPLCTYKKWDAHNKGDRKGQVIELLIHFSLTLLVSHYKDYSLFFLLLCLVQLPNIFSLKKKKSMKMTFHCYGCRMDLHLGLTLKICPVWRIQLWGVRFIHSFELLNWTPSQRGVEIGLSLPMQGYRHRPRAKHCRLNQMKYKLHTGSYAPLVIVIGFFWASKTTQPESEFYCRATDWEPPQLGLKQRSGHLFWRLKVKCRPFPRQLGCSSVRILPLQDKLSVNTSVNIMINLRPNKVDAPGLWVSY